VSHSKPADTQRLDAPGDDQHVAPIGPIGHVTAQHDQAQERQEFAQAHQPERQRIVRQRVHLPAHGHGEHLPA
jgi:hypothetical protein